MLKNEGTVDVEGSATVVTGREVKKTVYSREQARVTAVGVSQTWAPFCSESKKLSSKLQQGGQGRPRVVAHPLKDLRESMGGDEKRYSRKGRAKAHPARNTERNQHNLRRTKNEENFGG